MARIAILTFTEVSKDPRVMRHVDALRDEHAIVTCGKGTAPAGVSRHFEIPSGADHLPMTPVGLAALTLRQAHVAYRHLPAATAAGALLRGADFDAIISNDIAALPVALQVAGRRPVIADLHEYAPKEMEEDWRWRLLIQPFAEHICREDLPRASAVTTVAEGIAAEYEARYGVEVSTITNASPWRRPALRPVGDPIRAVHSGMATPNRHLDETIRAAAGLANITLDLLLVPSPRAPGHLRSLRRLAESTGNVRVLDPVPMAELPAALANYDIGVQVLRPVSFNYLHVLPNKLFDFVQAGLGVIIGPSPEMAALTRAHGLGRVLPDFEEGTLRSALRQLDPADVLGWKRAACDAAGALSSEHEAQKLRDIVAGVLSSETSGRIPSEDE